MEDNLIMDKVAQLPENLKAKVLEFVDFLLSKKNSGTREEISKPVFGSGKGMVIIKEGFDEPLEDFKEYM